MPNADPGIPGAPAPARGDGDPYSIRNFAYWLRYILGEAISESLQSLRRADKEAAYGWRDEAGENFRERLAAGMRRLTKFYDQVQRVATELDNYAHALERAQQRIDQARAIAESSEYIEVIDGVVYHPTNEDVRVGSEQYDWRDPLDPLDYLREVEKYDKISELVNEARTIIFGQEKFLDELLDALSSDAFFIAGDFVSGQGEYLAEVYQAKFTRFASEMEAEAALSYILAARIRDAVHFKKLGKLLAAPSEFIGAFHSKLAEAAHTGARGLSWTARLFKLGGVGLTVVSIGIDIYTGEPVEKIVLSTAGSLLGAAAATAFIGLLATPPGWVVVTVATVGGAVGGFAGSHLYDRTKPTPIIIDDNWAWQPS